MFQKLNVGEWIIGGVALISFVYIILKIFKKEFDAFRMIFTPAVGVFVILMVVNLVLTSGRWLSEWDEFSHWGRVTLNMYYSHAFGNCEGSTVMFTGYPPAVSLWEYFFVSMKSSFSEPYLFAANNVLAISMLIIVCKKDGWRKALIKGVLIFVLPLIFYKTFWTTVYVDGMLGCVLFYILYIYFGEEEKDKLKTAKILLALFMYPLIKAAGTGLACIAVFIMGIDILFFKKTKKNYKNKIVFLISGILTILVAEESWSIYLEMTNTNEAWNTSNLTIKNVVQFLNGNGQEYQYQTVKNFGSAIFEREVAGGCTLFVWCILILLVLVLLGNCRRWNRKKTIVYSGLIIGGIWIYALSLLILYCFTYSYLESLGLASYERYLGSIIMGIYLFLIFAYVDICTIRKEAILLACLLVVMMPVEALQKYTIDLNNDKQAVLDMRVSYENIKDFHTFMDVNNDKIYLIDQGSSGFSHVLGGYVATPLCFSPGYGWSLGEPLYEGDIWTQNYSLEEWKDILSKENYTYLYIHHMDNQFIEKYGDAFAEKAQIKNRALYIIIEDKNDIILRLYKEYGE
ncbi:MAG: hypothetical protein J6K37_00570 [Lachnospiraceae bacterium]|nr:hypothetical protein [Lachnospiraceae bacterium]